MFLNFGASRYWNIERLDEIPLVIENKREKGNSFIFKYKMTRSPPTHTPRIWYFLYFNRTKIKCVGVV